MERKSYKNYNEKICERPSKRVHIPATRSPRKNRENRREKFYSRNIGRITAHTPCKKRAQVSSTVDEKIQPTHCLTKVPDIKDKEIILRASRTKISSHLQRNKGN